jgi:hypothetical protein
MGREMRLKGKTAGDTDDFLWKTFEKSFNKDDLILPADQVFHRFFRYVLIYSPPNHFSA